MIKTYIVECIGKPRTNYGDSLKGEHCTGSITEKESIITEENGFTNIGYGNPMDYIDKLEKENKCTK